MATSPETKPETKTDRSGALECWIEQHAGMAAGLVLAAGFLARLWAASGTFLNPDEALHFRLANQVSLALAYQQSLTTVHPPLLILLLYFWRGLGTSELWLRMPSVLAGTVFCWAFYKWLARVMGQLAGFIGLLFAALLPPLIALSAEVRQYALLLAFLACALYFFERALAENSAALMLASTLSLYLAMLSHYSAFFFAAALGVYALTGIYAKRPSAPVTLAWALGQLGGLALLLFLYITHVSRLGGDDPAKVFQGGMSLDYISRSYFQPGRDNPVLFAIGHTFGVFQFLFGQLAVGVVAGLLFLAGIWWLLRRQALAGTSILPRRLALLLLLPFALVCGASFGRLYPYGGSRHVALLAIPALAGVSLAVVRLARGRWTHGVALAAVVAVVCLAFGKARLPTMERRDQSLAQMNAALEFLRQNARPAEPIFVDYQTDLLLGHYLCQQRPMRFNPAPAGSEEFSCGGFRVVCADYKTSWMFSPENFLNVWPQVASSYHLKAGDTIWVFQAGWSIAPAEGLHSHFADSRDLTIRNFGKNIRVFKLVIG